MQYRGYIVSLIIMVAISSVGGFYFFITDDSFLANKQAHHPDNIQEQIKQLENKITQLNHDFRQQQQAYQSLKTEVSKMNTLLTANGELSVKDQLLSSAKQTALINKNDVRELLLSLLEESITQQNQSIQDQQLEQEEIKKVSFENPEQARQFSIDRMAEKLQLNEQQKASYQQYVEEYAKLHEESNQQIAMDFKGEGPEKIQEHITEKLMQEEELSRQLEEDFLAMLDENQVQLYRKLPENERKILGNRFFSQSDF